MVSYGIKSVVGKFCALFILISVSFYQFGCEGDSGGDHKKTNGAPSIMVYCPTSVHETETATCFVEAADKERLSTLTCSVNAATTCSGVALTDCEEANIAAQGEAAGPGSCTVVIDVADDGKPSKSAQASFTFDIEEDNQDPTVEVACPTNVAEDAASSCALTVTDGDIPAQGATCSLNALTSCEGATIDDCAVVNLPAQGEAAPPDCAVVVDVEDDFDPIGAGMGSDDIIIDEINQNPVLTMDCPDNVNENAGGTCVLTATDGDVPAQTLTCSINGATTCAGATITSCSAVDIPAQGESAPSSCSVTVDVQDDFATPGNDEISDSITINEINSNPTIGVDCPNSVNETDATTCALTASDVDVSAQSLTCSVNPLTSCAGVTLTGCTQANVPAQGEGSSPSCTVVVNVQDNFTSPGSGVESDTMAVVEVNQNPALTMDCPDNVNENAGGTCVLTATDGDLPAQTLTCSINGGATTCAGATITGCSKVDVPAQGESAPSSCSVTVDVQDDFATPGNDEISDSITINEINSNPTIGVDCPNSVNETDATTCALTASDVDVSAQSLTCSVNPLTSCAGVTLTGCTQANVPAQGEGSSPSCTVVVNVQDNFTSPGSGVGSDTIAVVEVNQNPTLTMDCPDNVNENAGGTCVLTATDGDLPTQTLTCSINGATTCAGATITGCSKVDVPAQGESAPSSCSVTVDVQDNFSPAASTSANASITINEINNNPTVTVDCPSDMDENQSGVCTLTASDDDDPAQSLTCSLSTQTSCAGATITGCSTVNVPAQGEESPNSCSVVVAVEDDFGSPGAGQGSDRIIINQLNSNPTVKVTCPESVGEMSETNCAITASDSDYPPQRLGCKINDTLTTCDEAYMEDSSCEAAHIGVQGEEEGPGECTLVVDITDEDGATARGSADLTIEEENSSPYWTSQADDIVTPLLVSYDNDNIQAADDDLPNDTPLDPGYLNCQKVSDTCSFWPFVSSDIDYDGTVNCEISFSAPSSPEQCELTLKVTDMMGAGIQKTIKITATNVWYVDASVATTGDGTTWVTAFQTLQEGMDAASYGEAVWVADGDYYANSVSSPESVLEMEDGVMVFGGFEGDEDSTSDRTTPISNSTVLDGQGNICHVVLGASNAILDGFRLTGGYAYGDGGSYYSCYYGGGGGIYNHYVYNTQFSNLFISYNNAVMFDYDPFYSNGGGGVKNFYSKVSFKNNRIYNNYTSGYNTISGGGISNVRSELFIYNNVLRNNYAGRMGGGILNLGSNLTIDSSYFYGNDAYRRGGAIANYQSYGMDISNTGFFSNRAEYGGAIFNADGVTQISHSDFGYNYAYILGGAIENVGFLAVKDDSRIYSNSAWGGGGIDTYYSTNFISNSILDGNYAEVSGGGISASDSRVIITDSKIENNMAHGSDDLVYDGNGGGMDISSTDVYIINSSLSYNSAYYHGAGVFNYDSYFYMYGSAINENSLDSGSGYGAGMYNKNSDIYIGYSSVSGNYTNDEGAGMFNNYSDTQISNSILNDNVSYCDGGAVYDEAGSIAIYGSIIKDNYANDDGAGVYVSYGHLRISDSILSDNYSGASGGGTAVFGNSDAHIYYTKFENNRADYGGALSLRYGSGASVVNGLFFGNKTDGGYDGWYGEGGAIHAGEGTYADINSSTFNGNMAEEGGAIYAYTPDISISNSILWGDVAEYGNEIYSYYYSVNVTYSNIEGGYYGDGNINNDPLFTNTPRMWDFTTDMTLDDNSIYVDDASQYLVNEIIEIDMDGVGRVVLDATGNILTFAPALYNPADDGVLVQNWGASPASLDEDYHLLLGSPSIDTGASSGAPSYDIEHNSRPSGSGYDMGAYEYIFPVVPE